MIVVGRGMGAAAPAPTELHNKITADFNRIISELSAKFNAPITYAALYKVLEPELARAKDFQTQKPPAPSTLAVRVAALVRVRNAAKVAYANTPNTRVPEPERIAARDAATDIMRWLASVLGQALTDSNARAQTVKDIVGAIKDAPKEVIGWAFDSLGLPRWLLPVALVVTGLIVVGQVTGGLKALLPARTVAA